MDIHRPSADRLRTCTREEIGQSLVEFALAASAILLLVLALVDLGRLVHIYTALHAAAQAGARAGVTSSEPTTMQAAVTAYLSDMAVPSPSITAVRTPTYAQVDLTVSFQPITPFIAAIFPGQGIVLHTGAQIRLLGGEGEAGAQAGSPPPTDTPGPTPTNPPPTATPTPGNQPTPTPTPCWPPGKCKNK